MTESDPPTPLPELLTPKETAAFLRTTVASIYQMISRGQLPGVTRVGRRVLVRRDDVRKWLGLSVEKKASAGVSKSSPPHFKV